MNDQNHINEKHLAASVDESIQHHPADNFNREGRNKPPVMSKLQVWLKVLHWVFWICLAVAAFITLPFYYALGAVYAVPLMMVIVWAVWPMVRGKT